MAPIRKSSRSSPYISAAKSRSLLINSRAVLRQRLLADDMLSCNEAAELTNTTPNVVESWIARGQVISLNHPRGGVRLPKWQFEPAMRGAMADLVKALGTRDGWALLAFLETPLGGLNGATPRQAIERGDAARVFELAAIEGP